MDHGWELILDLLIALAGALILGLLAERIKVNAIIGYLLAGAILGPGGLKIVDQASETNLIAEIGVSLLLFTIGLEFSWRRMLRLDRRALIGGVLAIFATTVIISTAAIALGVAWQSSIILGAAGSLSSTAIVLRVLRGANDLDTSHGKTALSTLLLQDLAMVPLVLLVTFLSSGSTDIAAQLGRAAGATAALVLVLVVLTSVIVPRLLDERIIARNRELPIILAIATCVGSAFAAHKLGVSPALGAFFAGMLLAESPFADQMRSDVFPLRTLFVTIFFVSVGLLADLGWLVAHFPLVLAVTFGVMSLKTVATYLSLRPFVHGIIEPLATALAISQVGEFSFVLLEIGRKAGRIDPPVFQLFISVILVSLIITPALTGNARTVARRIAKVLFPARKLAKSERTSRPTALTDHFILVGFGEAGQAVAHSLDELRSRLLVLELSSPLSKVATGQGYMSAVGDATQHEILESVHIDKASAVIVTVPDHNAARAIVSQAKSLAPGIPVYVRARYHVFKDELDIAGADCVVDEEMLVGDQLAKMLLAATQPTQVHGSGQPHRLDSHDNYGG